MRAAQCREGWHRNREPDLEPDQATDDQQWWIENRAEVQARRALLLLATFANLRFG